MIIIDRRKEEQMKKVLAVLLVVLMLASLGAAAFADGDELMDMSGTIDLANQLLSNAGVSYPTVQIPDNFDDIFQISGFPTSYFIDSSGRILGNPIEGAQVDKYEEAIMGLLNGGEENTSDRAPSFMGNVGALKTGGKAVPAPTASSPYRIICVDESGNPVPGATVQFCSDIQCMMAKTDADGVAVFDQVPGQYTVHLLKAPAGFAKDSEAYEAPSVPGDLTIVLKAG